MHKKKNLPQKQSSKQLKRKPLNPLNYFNYTEELLPQNSIDIKNMNKSIQLKRYNTNQHIKKNQSRKSRSKSVKQNIVGNVKFKNIMKQFRELKILQENQISKSKSPTSFKSKSVKKYCMPKPSFKALRTNPNSEVNLTLKLERTIKKLNQTDYFKDEKDEESLIPIISSSDIYDHNISHEIIISQNEEDINISEIRDICSTINLKQKKNVRKIDGSEQVVRRFAATRIQRAWRKYRSEKTKKIIDQYVYFSGKVDTEELDEWTSPRKENQPQYQPFDVIQRDDDVLQPLYPQETHHHIVTHISNLEGQEEILIRGDRNDQIQEEQSYEGLVNRIKLQQLEKWNQIIEIISKHKSNNPKELEHLLKKLAAKSEVNKKDLQQKANQILSLTGSKKIDEKEQQNFQQSSLEQKKSSSNQSNVNIPLSQQSQKSQGNKLEYDSKKYIQYLDGDIFVEHNSEEANENSNGRISKKKQSTLLENLKSSNVPLRLGFYRCESLKTLKNFKPTHEKQKSSSSLKKSTSQKILKRTIRTISPNFFEKLQKQDDINFELLTKEFLEGGDPSEGFDLFHNEQKLKQKFKQLRAIQEADQAFPIDQQIPMDPFETIYEEKEEDQSSQEVNKPFLQREMNSNQLQQRQSYIQDLSSDEDLTHKQTKEKVEEMANQLFQNQILYLLKQVTKYEKTILQRFKSHYLGVVKTKVRKVQNRKAKGFNTTKVQIESFLQNLIRFLTKNHIKILKNLQVATGPSALQMLKYMHAPADDEQSIECQSDEDESNVMVIPNRAFDQFWGLKQKNLVIEISSGVDHSNEVLLRQQFQYLKGFNKIFYRSLFDGFNECLDFQRNFGQFGKPFPWKNNANFFHTKSQDALKSNVQSARKRMMDISTTYCGLIIQRQQMQGLSGNEQYIQQVQEDRLSRMLASDLIEAQPKWMFYDDEETQILIEMSNKIYLEILLELVEDFYRISGWL